MNAPKKIGAAACVLCMAAVLVLQLAVTTLQAGSDDQQSNYPVLKPDETQSDPLIGLNSDFTPNRDFATNLPIVVLDVAEDIPRYIMNAKESDEMSTSDLDARWVEGTLLLYDNADSGVTTLQDTPVAESRIRIKRRGHSSMKFDKPQYKVVTLQADGTENPLDLLGMGADNEWVLNGSMADKSMLRNYIAYRIASEIRPETPDCRFCEVFLKKNGVCEYQGVYLLTESISRSKNRINIDKAKKKNVYTSYIVRRDRYNLYDPMLNTWARASGLCPEDQWIGVKYPGKNKLTEHSLDYITADFSSIEQVIYSEDFNVFRTYNRYIDVDSFADYFLINEFFGNYDSGEHSTYMWKNTGEKLHIGPVWDFDEAMNNVYSEEQDPDTLAMTEKPFFKQLIQDEKFLDKLIARYAALRRSTLSEEHVFAVLEEAQRHIANAQKREWYRWAADYQDNSRTNRHNYYLDPYKIDDVELERFTTQYEQELYNIRTYLSRHSAKISVELKKLEDFTTFDTDAESINGLLLAIVMMMFLLPSYILNRRK